MPFARAIQELWRKISKAAISISYCAEQLDAPIVKALTILQ